MEFEREYSRLNSAQKKAVDLIDGPLIVIAGPGTGKTQLLSMRTANILNQTDTLPENILCLTFTEAASENMRIRLSNLIGKSANQVGIFTFHGFGTHIIQNYPEFFYEAPLLGRLNELGEYNLLEKLMNKLHHDNPLAKKVSGAFLHLPSVLRIISWLKQAGLNPDDLRIETTKNQSFFKAGVKLLNPVFGSSPSAKNLKLYVDLYNQLEKLLHKYPCRTGDQLVGELLDAIDKVDLSGKYAQSITTWRNKWLSQFKKGEWQFADQAKNTLLLRLADLYENYQQSLTESGLYTFDDMILRTNYAIENNEELKLNLQEKYQYILVDEYQDTNGAQDKILNQLADNPVNEQRPNLMVVGDDDQAIYRFQGAESSVMLDFIQRWQPEEIVLTESYRSGQSLLDLARGVILNAEDRLENSDPKLIKKLVSKTKLKDTSISEIYSASEIENYVNTANQIKKLIDSGQDPSNISVLAPKHRYLEELVPYLLKLNLPINYERREQVLQQPRIIELLDLIELVAAASKHQSSKIDSLLAKILAADYWQLSAETLWQLAIDSQNNHQGWFKLLESSENIILKNFSESIKILSKEAKNQSFDLLLAYLTGSKSITLTNEKPWNLPWRDFYFSDKQLDKDPVGYINFMSQLEALKQSFREWQPNTNRLITLNDFDEFIKLFQKTKIKLNDNSPYTSSKNAITLMTVYKAKGLEWESVFVLNIEEDVWGSKTRTRHESFSLPTSLKWIEPASDNSNDLVRLFYVGITRSRKSLFLTGYKIKSSGLPAERLQWLENLLPDPSPLKSLPTSVIVSSYEYNWQDVYTSPTKDLNLLLKPVLDTYKLSSTHLNDFLSVDRGGPKSFLYKHILKVPEELNPNAIYGDSIHKTLEYLHKQFNSSQKLPDKQAIKDYFIEKLTNQPLTSEEFRFFKKRGEDNLIGWLDLNQKKFSPLDISEHNFSSEQIVVEGAKLTGKIDIIREEGKDYVTVIDYKTSLPLSEWTGHSGNAAINVHKYQNQLLFYKLLLDNSTYLKKKKLANRGVIEFITPDQDNNYIELSYDYEEKELKRLTKLVGIVWNKIMLLDLPNTDDYPSTIKGIRSFEEDLLEGKI